MILLYVLLYCSLVVYSQELILISECSGLPFGPYKSFDHVCCVLNENDVWCESDDADIISDNIGGGCFDASSLCTCNDSGPSYAKTHWVQYSSRSMLQSRRVPWPLGAEDTFLDAWKWIEILNAILPVNDGGTLWLYLGQEWITWNLNYLNGKRTCDQEQIKNVARALLILSNFPQGIPDEYTSGTILLYNIVSTYNGDT